GYSTFTIRPSIMSSTCTDNPPTFKILNDCNPSKWLSFVIPNYPDEIVVNSSMVFKDGASMVQNLPSNYRPPSHFGNAVPISPHIYNSDPSKPRYNDVWKISMNSGTYKQCKDKTSRSECACSDSQKGGNKLDESDCIEMVIRTYFVQAFKPSFKIYETTKLKKVDSSSYLNSPFKIEELNGRQDWCLNTVSDCSKGDWIKNATMNPQNGDYIRWKGDELFHFRVTTLEGDYCNLSTDFVVYVISPPMRSSTQIVTMAVTAVTFAFWLLGIYLWYSYKTG
ncbi:cation channel sperm-associated protein subunit beta, partial [Paraphysoderma sedebokerense]